MEAVRALGGAARGVRAGRGAAVVAAEAAAHPGAQAVPRVGRRHVHARHAPPGKRPPRQPCLLPLYLLGPQRELPAGATAPSSPLHTHSPHDACLPACLQPRFLALAYAVALSALLVIEYVRMSRRVLWVGGVVHAFYSNFLDERDMGNLVVTHLYLLLGCAFPLWVSWLPARANPFVPYAGILALGIGDAAVRVITTTAHSLASCWYACLGEVGQAAPYLPSGPATCWLGVVLVPLRRRRWAACSASTVGRPRTARWRALRPWW